MEHKAEYTSELWERYANYMTDKYGDDHKLYKGHDPSGGTTTEKTTGASTDSSQSTYYAKKSTYKAPAATTPKAKPAPAPVKPASTTYYRSYYRPQASSSGAMKLNYYYGTYTYWSYNAGSSYDYTYWYYDW